MTEDVKKMAKKDGEFKPKKVCLEYGEHESPPTVTISTDKRVFRNTQASKKGGAGKKLTGFMLFR